MGLMSPIWKRRRRGVEFDPASIVDGSGNRLLLQLLFSKTALSGGSVIPDESTNKGSARAIQLGKCYLFDGTNDIVDYGNVANVTGNFTISIRLNSSNTAKSFMEVFGKGTGGVAYDMYFSSTTGLLQFRANIGGVARTVTTTSPLSNNTDYHVVIRYDGAQLTMFVNGVSAATPTACTGAVGVVANPLYLARINGSSFFVGKIWDFRIYDSFLSDADVTTVYNYSSLTALPLVWYKCDEGAGTISYNSIASAGNGTITNATLATFHSTQNLYSYQNEAGYCNYMDFDGVDDAVRAAAVDAANSGDFAISMNVVTPSPTKGAMMYATNSNGGATTSSFELRANGTTGRLECVISIGGSAYGTGIGATALLPNTKYRIAARRSGSEISVWINGVKDGFVNQAGARITGAVFGLGRRAAASGPHYFIGAMWDVKYWNTAVSDADMLADGIGSTISVAPQFTLLGYGNTEANWNSTTPVTIEGSPALLYVPRNEAIPAQNVLGSALQFTGRVPYNALLKQSNCLDFDGTNDYVQCPGSFDLNLVGNTIRIKTWFILDAIGINQTLFSQGEVASGGYALIVSNGNTLSFNTKQAASGSGHRSFTGTVTLAASTPYLLDITIEPGATAVTATLNGVAYAMPTTAVTGVYGDAVTPVLLGSRQGGATYLNGKMFGVEFYKNSTLQALYNLAEGAGTIAYDTSGNNNHATLINGVAWAKQDSYHANINEGFSRYPYFGTVGSIVFPLYSTTAVNRISIDFFTTTAIDKTSASIALLALGSANTNDFRLGAASGAISDEVITIFGSAGERTYVQNITIPIGRHTIDFIWNGTNYIIYLDGVIQTTLHSGTMAKITPTTYTFGSFLSVAPPASVYGLRLYNTSDVLVSSISNIGSPELTTGWYDATRALNASSVSGVSTIRIPAKSDSLDAVNEGLLNPSGIFHNNAETLIDFTGNVASPAAVIGSWENAWAFNTARTNPKFKRTLTLDGVDHRADRFLTYSTALSGGDLTKVQDYTATKAV